MSQSSQLVLQHFMKSKKTKNIKIKSEKINNSFIICFNKLLSYYESDNILDININSELSMNNKLK